MAYYLLRAIQIYQFILIAYAFSTWISTDNMTVLKIKYFLKRAADLIIAPIEELVPQLRFFSVIIAILILNLLSSVVANSLF
jgi:uncharacterized protein YggT (Ycf19 family)